MRRLRIEPLTTSAPTIWERLAAYCLGVGLIYGTWAQGGFYRRQFEVVAGLVVVAALLRVRIPVRPSRPALLTIAALVVFAGWSLLAGALAGDVVAAEPMAFVAVCSALALYVTDAFRERARDVFLYVVVGTGLLVAISSWMGVVFHHQPWALLSQGLWRGASTLTYANAAASFLAVALFVALRFFLQRPSSPALLVLYLLALGWVTTFSRASGIGMALSFVVLVVMLDQRRKLLQLWPLAPALVVATVGFLPSLSEQSTSHPAMAAFGVCAGAVVVLAFNRVPSKRVIAVSIIAMIGVGDAALGYSGGSVGDAVDRITTTRLTAASSDRGDLTSVTWAQFVDHPLAGVGPDQLDFEYVNHDGLLVQAQFTHNEYLQLAAETGVVGLIFLVVVVGGLLAVAVRQRRVTRSDAAVAAAVLVGFCAHSGLDFLWHIPVLPLLVVMTIGTLGSHSGRATTFGGSLI